MSTSIEHRNSMSQESVVFMFDSRIDELMSDVSAASTGKEGLLRVKRDIIYAPEFRRIMEAPENTANKLASICDVCNSSCDVNCVICNRCNTCTSCMSGGQCHDIWSIPTQSPLQCLESTDRVGEGSPSCFVMQI